MDEGVGKRMQVRLRSADMTSGFGVLYGWRWLQAGTEGLTSEDDKSKIEDLNYKGKIDLSLCIINSALASKEVLS